MCNISQMNNKQLDLLIENYNWDNGFKLPSAVTNNENCELATALKVFYLADGFSYLSDSTKPSIYLMDWYNFVSNLYNRLLEGIYCYGELHYSVPLTKVQIYRLKKANIPLVFLTDV
ncbi:DUF4274 domain-containing protein [Crassaminicella profunda]|uniref:DUF4274 domain-containing protein n=1 Tax=Crassaminicella profunda TaxID=1286698 RepID=UPI001CA6C81D|nr:DUF4274 domain-containing protein [Crassaminicella profunda]QZY56648.1 DUF4274 domain-containing protein [Crassaminicella profunda]